MPRTRSHTKTGRPGERWLITGAKGMLGRDLVALLEREGEDVTGIWPQ